MQARNLDGGHMFSSGSWAPQKWDVKWHHPWQSHCIPPHIHCLLNFKCKAHKLPNRQALSSVSRESRIVAAIVDRMLTANNSGPWIEPYCYLILLVVMSVLTELLFSDAQKRQDCVILGWFCCQNPIVILQVPYGKECVVDAHPHSKNKYTVCRFPEGVYTSLTCSRHTPVCMSEPSCS